MSEPVQAGSGVGLRVLWSQGADFRQEGVALASPLPRSHALCATPLLIKTEPVHWQLLCVEKGLQVLHLLLLAPGVAFWLQLF